MSVWIKNGTHWCKVEDPQPDFAEIEARLDSRFRDPRQRGLKKTKCNALVGGSAHAEPLDAQPLCQKQGCKS